jgi:diguanylate cyclase (GGDEF)-like protein
MEAGLVPMTFHKQNILIACSEKKDRLQFFNYFDELDAEKIFTATDIGQMESMLAGEDQFSVLVFELSQQWVKNNNQIIQLQVQYPALKLVGLVSAQVELKHHQYQEISSHLDDLVFSPVMQHELVAKNIAVVGSNQQNNDSHSQDELDNFIHAYFEPSGFPQLLIGVNDHAIKFANKALLKKFEVNKSDLIDQVWHQMIAVNKNTGIEELTAQLTETGQIIQQVRFNLSGSFYPIELRMSYSTIGDQPYYLAELHDLTTQVYQQKFLQNLEQVTTLDFDNRQQKEQMMVLLKWARFDFCFIVKKSLSGDYDQIVWDCSLNNYAQKFITARHDFLFRKVDAEGFYAIRNKASEVIPGDDFLNYYTINAILLFDCYVDDDNDAALIVGSLKEVDNWSSLKLLFKQLSLHYKQSMAFKILQHSHESESQYDVLTNLLNRRYIVKTIEQSIQSNPNFNAVMFLDLDRFKVINDSLGHDVGDEVLVNIANILQHHVSSHGVAARYAGDEFLILLNHEVDSDKTKQIADAILKSVGRPIKLNSGSEINLTISLGVAYYPEHGQNVSKLIKHADIALYDAKLNGKNRYTIYDNNLDGDHTKQNEEMVKNLQNAIDENQIDVYFQPKIDAKTEDIMGFEALVRWEHPDLGIISPGLFIPLAEQSDLIDQIGLLVIEKSCLMLKKWQRTYTLPLNMSVNLSPVQLNDKNLTEKISDIITRTGIYPKHLDFEITESEKFKSVKDALLMFKKIVNLGCTLSIDDFGTGHSTLDYLRKIPAKTLKIDQVFVKNIGLSPDDEAILDATIDMAKRVGHEIVAEGVETEEQRIYLSQKGCDYFQGYLFCRPVPAKDIERILSQRAEILKNK